MALETYELGEQQVEEIAPGRRGRRREHEAAVALIGDRTAVFEINAIVSEGARLKESALRRYMELFTRLLRAAERDERILDALQPDSIPSDTHLAQLRRNAEAREAALDEFGSYSAADIARLRGSKTTNPHSLTGRWVRDKAVFAIETPTERRFPAFQFDALGAPKTSVAPVLRALPPGLSGWETLLWFTRNDGHLGGPRPVDLLDSAPDRVADAAAYLAAIVNEE